MLIKIVYDQMHGKLPSQECCFFEIHEMDLVCALSGEILTDAVIASDGYSYQRQSIEKFFSSQLDKNNVLSPKTGEILLVDNNEQLVLRKNYLVEQVNTSKLILCAELEHYLLDCNSHNYYINKSKPFANKLAYKLVNDFWQKYFKLYEVRDLEIRALFKLLFNQERKLCQYKLRQKSELAFKPLTVSGGEYLLHFFAAMGDLEMIQFLVKELNVPLDQKSTVKQASILFYLPSSNGLEIINYWQEQKLASANDEHSNFNILMHGIITNNLDLVEYVFGQGLSFKKDPSYFAELQCRLAHSSYEIMLCVLSKLKEESRVFASLSFVHFLASNRILHETQLATLFMLCGDYLQTNSLNAGNPYCLAVINDNRRYLKILHCYWQNLRLPAIIDQRTVDNPDLALALAIDSNDYYLITVLLSCGAKPNFSYKYSKSYPLAQALFKDDKKLFTILKSYNVDFQSLLIIEIIPALVTVKSFTIDDFLFILHRLDKNAFAQIYGDYSTKEILLKGIIEHNNINLFFALEWVFGTIDINPKHPSVKIGNKLHLAITYNNLQFAKYFMENNPDLLWEHNTKYINPLMLVASHGAFDLIFVLFEKAQSSQPFKDLKPELSRLILANRLLSDEQKSYLQRHYLTLLKKPILAV